MGNINGKWIMFGCGHNDAQRLKTYWETIEYINQIGFLPLFMNEIPGFSLEERTVSDYWWSGDEKNDPWEWRRIIAQTQKVAYGKFFGGKAGFISLDLLPHFINWRRDGYDFDALWDNGKAKFKEKQIMDLFIDCDVNNTSTLRRKLSGNGKGAKNLDPVLNSLQMKLYLVIKDFSQKTNKQGEPYGWHLAEYSTPESIWGYDFVTSGYKADPLESKEIICNVLKNEYPDIPEQRIESLLKF